MNIDTFKRNWILHYIKPEFLYLPREKSEPVKATLSFNIKVRQKRWYESSYSTQSISGYLIYLGNNKRSFKIINTTASSSIGISRLGYYAFIPLTYPSLEAPFSAKDFFIFKQEEFENKTYTIYTIDYPYRVYTFFEEEGTTQTAKARRFVIGKNVSITEGGGASWSNVYLTDLQFSELLAEDGQTVLKAKGAPFQFQELDISCYFFQNRFSCVAGRFYIYEGKIYECLVTYIASETGFLPENMLFITNYISSTLPSIRLSLKTTIVVNNVDTNISYIVPDDAKTQGYLWNGRKIIVGETDSRYYTAYFNPSDRRDSYLYPYNYYYTNNRLTTGEELQFLAFNNNFTYSSPKQYGFTIDTINYNGVRTGSGYLSGSVRAHETGVTDYTKAHFSSWIPVDSTYIFYPRIGGDGDISKVSGDYFLPRNYYPRNNNYDYHFRGQEFKTLRLSSDNTTENYSAYRINANTSHSIIQRIVQNFSNFRPGHGNEEGLHYSDRYCADLPLYSRGTTAPTAVVLNPNNSRYSHEGSYTMDFVWKNNYSLIRNNHTILYWATYFNEDLDLGSTVIPVGELGSLPDRKDDLSFREGLTLSSSYRYYDSLAEQKADFLDIIHRGNENEIGQVYTLSLE